MAAKKGDEDIDTSDIPEIRSLPPGAVRGGLRQLSAVHLIPEIHAYFSAIAVRKQLSLDRLIKEILAKEVAIMEAVK